MQISSRYHRLVRLRPEKPSCGSWEGFKKGISPGGFAHDLFRSVHALEADFYLNICSKDCCSPSTSRLRNESIAVLHYQLLGRADRTPGGDLKGVVQEVKSVGADIQN